MDYKQLIELDGYINLWEVLPEDKHSKISNLIWKALDDEDDLIEEVTTASGWCIKSIDYEIQLK